MCQLKPSPSDRTVPNKPWPSPALRERHPSRAAAPRRWAWSDQKQTLCVKAPTKAGKHPGRWRGRGAAPSRAFRGIFRALRAADKDRPCRAGAGAAVTGGCPSLTRAHSARSHSGRAGHAALPVCPLPASAGTHKSAEKLLMGSRQSLNGTDAFLPSGSIARE